MQADYDALRTRHAAKNDRPLATVAEARAARTPIEWRATGRPGRACCSSRTTTSRRSRAAAARPARAGLPDVDLAELRRYIDWQPFFNAWEMKGSFPEILDDAESGETARKLYDDAQAMLDQLIEERWLTAQRRGRALPGQRGGRRRRGLPRRGARPRPHAVLHHLRQQGAHRAGVPNRCAGRLRRPQGDRAAATTSACSR